jgi:hypothetical protein
VVADPPYTSPPANDANPNDQDEGIPELDVRDVLARAGLTPKQIDFALASLDSGVINGAYRQIPLRQQPVQVHPAPAGATRAQLLQHAFDTLRAMVPGREVSIRALEQAADAARLELPDATQPEPALPPEALPAAAQAEPSPSANLVPGEPGWSALLHGIPPSKAWLEERQTSPELQRHVAEQAHEEAEELRRKLQVEQLARTEAEAEAKKARADIKRAGAEARRKLLAAQKARAEALRAAEEQALSEMDQARADAAEQLAASRIAAEILRRDLSAEKIARAKAEADAEDLRRQAASLQVEPGSIEAPPQTPPVPEAKKRRNRENLSSAHKKIAKDCLDANESAGVDSIIMPALEEKGMFPNREELRQYVAQEKEQRAKARTNPQ